MDYVIIPSLASGMFQNFSDCALTCPFNSRHVTELHGLPNDGRQVSRSDQSRVASQQTDGPRMKLGYDNTCINCFYVPIFLAGCPY